MLWVIFYGKLRLFTRDGLVKNNELNDVLSLTRHHKIQANDGALYYSEIFLIKKILIRIHIVSKMKSTLKLDM